MGLSDLCLAGSRDPAPRPQSPRSTQHHRGSHSFSRHPQAGSFRERAPGRSDLRYRVGSDRRLAGTRPSRLRRGGPAAGPAPDAAPPQASAAGFAAPFCRGSASCGCCGTFLQPLPKCRCCCSLLRLAYVFTSMQTPRFFNKCARLAPCPPPG